MITTCCVHGDMKIEKWLLNRHGDNFSLIRNGLRFEFKPLDQGIGLLFIYAENGFNLIKIRIWIDGPFFMVGEIHFNMEIGLEKDYWKISKYCRSF